MGFCALLESRDAVVDQFGFRVGVVGEFGLLASEGETLQEMCGALLVENGKTGESLVKMVFVNVGDVGTLGFDQLESSITKPFVATDQCAEVCIHLGGY
jgi:hypothetical protein